MREWGFIVTRADQTKPDGAEFVFQAETHALNHARQKAQQTGEPQAVYKIVQTHYVKPIEPVVEKIQ